MLLVDTLELFQGKIYLKMPDASLPQDHPGIFSKVPSCILARV